MNKSPPSRTRVKCLVGFGLEGTFTLEADSAVGSRGRAVNAASALVATLLGLTSPSDNHDSQRELLVLTGEERREEAREGKRASPLVYRSRAGAACQNRPQWKDDTRPGSERQAGFGPHPQQTGICSPTRLVLEEATAEGKTGKGQGGGWPAPRPDPVRRVGD